MEWNLSGWSLHTTLGRVLSVAFPYGLHHLIAFVIMWWTCQICIFYLLPSESKGKKWWKLLASVKSWSPIRSYLGLDSSSQVLSRTNPWSQWKYSSADWISRAIAH